MLDGGDHQILDVLGRDAAGRRYMPHCFSVAAVEREGDAHLLAIVAADLERVGAPTGVAQIDRYPAVVPPFVAAAAAVTQKEQPVHLHHAIDALRVGRCAPGLLGLATQQCMYATIAVGGQIGDQRADVGDQLGIGERWSPPLAQWPPVAHRGQVLPSDAESVGHHCHRPSPGNEVERSRSLWDGPPLTIWRSLVSDQEERTYDEDADSYARDQSG